MFFFFFLLVSSLYALVGRQIVVGDHLPLICLTPKFLSLLVLLIDVVNTCRGFQTSKAVCL
jgi:hypothetical protein